MCSAFEVHMFNRCAIHLQQCKYHMHITLHMEQIQLTRCTSYVKLQHMCINMYFLPVNQSLSEHGHVLFCTSTKRHFYYMPMRVTHKNNLRVRNPRSYRIIFLINIPMIWNYSFASYTAHQWYQQHACSNNLAKKVSTFSSSAFKWCIIFPILLLHDAPWLFYTPLWVT